MLTSYFSFELGEWGWFQNYRSDYLSHLHVFLIYIYSVLMTNSNFSIVSNMLFAIFIINRILIENSRQMSKNQLIIQVFGVLFLLLN